VLEVDTLTMMTWTDVQIGSRNIENWEIPSVKIVPIGGGIDLANLILIVVVAHVEVETGRRSSEKCQMYRVGAVGCRMIRSSLGWSLYLLVNPKTYGKKNVELMTRELGESSYQEVRALQKECLELQTSKRAQYWRVAEGSRAVAWDEWKLGEEEENGDPRHLEKSFVVQ